MKQTQEFDGKNVDNAVEKACLALNISKKNLVYDVISSGSTGIFGIVGVKKARIRVTLPEKKGNNDINSSSSYDSDRAGIMSIVDEAFGRDGTIVNQNSVSSNNLIIESSASENAIEPEHFTIEESVEPEVIEQHSENTKHPDNRKKTFGEKTASPKSRKGKSFSRKPAVEKVDDEKSLTKPLADADLLLNSNAPKGSDIEKNIEKNIDEKPAANKHFREKFSGNKPSKPSNRKRRNRNKDTWLRDDGDTVLSEAIASSDKIENLSEDKVQQFVETKPTTNKETVESGVKQRVTELNNLPEDTKSSDAFNGNYINGEYIDSDEEFLDEGFRVSSEDDFEEDDTSDVKVEDEILDLYDERDDGYPPKYKGEVPVDVSEEAMRVGKETLQKMVALITDNAIVTAQSDEDRLLLRVEGGNSGVLIGRRGQTLEAMQYLTDKIINRYSESRVRLKVDIEGYLETRKANLKTLAYKMADKAKKTGKPATINQMTAQDRRIIHLTLKDDTRVRTQSMGEGYYRRLVIFPKKSSFRRKRTFRK